MISVTTDPKFDTTVEPEVPLYSFETASLTTDVDPSEYIFNTYIIRPESTYSDMSIMGMDTVELSLIELNNYTETIYMPCSISGSTNILYTIEQNGLNSIPNFVTYDDIAFELTIQAPSVLADTFYTFILRATDGANEYDRIIVFTVYDCLVLDCMI